MIRAYATDQPGGELKSFTFDPGPLKNDQVEVAVEYCGICHSDLSMLNNDWGMTAYPFVPGHEVAGTIVAVGPHVDETRIGQRVGVGWYSGSCMHCEWCMSGDHNLCQTAEATIIGRYGGFADKVRCQAEWAIPLPESVASDSAGPLFCGGITVFNPIVQFNVKPTDRVGVIGIGGLGHMALGFLNAWGSDVTAFSSSPDKEAEARRLGANHFIATRDKGALDAVKNSFDFILVTANVDLDWQNYMDALRPKGRLHFVGAVPNPVPAAIFPMIIGQKSISGSPLGSPATTAKMLDFTSRHRFAPIIETYPMSQVNQAVKRLESGKARYRVVLKNDF